MTKVCVTGGREYDNAARCGSVLGAFHSANPITLLIEGGARGADQLAREWATAHGVPVRTFIAEWRRYGPKAGPIRNTRMIVEGEPEVVIAFPGGRGTANCVSVARAHGIEVLAVAHGEAK